jgi:transglutaminase-like putative cysteine protease/tetratricopeptide (TPR) repeat protein
MPYRLLLAGLILFCAASLGASQSDAPPFSLSPKALLESAGPRDAKNLYGLTIVLNEMTMVFQADHRLTHRRHIVFRIDSPEAARGAQVATLWSPWYQKRPNVRARVVTPDGAAHELDPATLTDSAPNQQPDLYEDLRILTGPLPAAEAGAVVEQWEEIEDTQAYFAAGVVRRVAFGAAVPVMATRLTVDAPASLPLKHVARLLPNLTVTKEQTGTGIRLRFEYGRLDAVEAPEPGMPADVATTPHVTLSTAESWRDVARGYAALVDRQLSATDLIALQKKTTRGGTGAVSEGAAVIAEVVSTLHREVRYTGVEFGQAALVPRTPKEVLERKYGDCKDKALLLVAMLRARGITAHVALLSAGLGLDVDPDMPGLGAFDHAIVVVPGSPDVWVDPTAAFHGAKSLPYADQDRLALVVAADTTGLRKTPAFRAEDNSLIETRDIVLPDFGSARVSVTSETRGEVDATYRSLLGGSDSTQLRQYFDGTGKRVFRAESEVRYERGDGANLDTPFRVQFTIDKAAVGATELDTATVSIAPDGILEMLPVYLRSTDADETARSSPRPARKDDFVFLPSVHEWRYRVTPPQAFRASQVPESRSVALGPAKYSQSFREEADGSVSGTIRLDSVRGRYTAAEVLATRQAAQEWAKTEGLKVTFTHVGATQLAAGKIREALDTYRSQVSRRPADPLHKIRLSRALLKSGLGELARLEAKAAVALDPKSTDAHRNLGRVLSSDLYGREWRRGWDRDGTIAAYRRAVELKPADGSIRVDLAVALEHDLNGARYAAKADVAEAIAAYRELEKEDKATANRYIDHLLYALLYHGNFEELRTRLTGRPPTREHLALTLAAIAATDGASKALAEAPRLAADASLRSQALSTAGGMLRRMRRYAPSAELIAAAADGSLDSTAVVTAQDLRSAKPFEEILLPTSDPRSLVQQLYLVATDPAAITPQAVRTFGDSLPPSTDKAKQFRTWTDGLRMSLFRGGPSREMAIDAVLATTTVTVEGDVALGFRLRAQRPGGTIVQYAVVENGSPRILGAPPAAVFAVGREALRRLASHDNVGAKHLLDWVREDVPVGGGDDPLSGSMFPRLWNRDDSADPARMRLAAIALLAGDEEMSAYLDDLRKASAAAQAPQAQATLDALLLRGLMTAMKWSEARDVGKRLMDGQKGSAFAFLVHGEACRMLKDWERWSQSISERLSRLPDDRDALRSRAQLLLAQGQFAAARQVIKGLIDSGRAEGSEFNNYAWYALFQSSVGQAEIDAAQRATSLTRNTNPSSLHTLACVLADAGRTKEAWDVFLRILDLTGYAELDSSLWFLYGRIAEQYGETSAAMAAYRRVERPRATDEPRSSTWALAQGRLSALTKTGRSGS